METESLFGGCVLHVPDEAVYNFADLQSAEKLINLHVPWVGKVHT